MLTNSAVLEVGNTDNDMGTDHHIGSAESTHPHERSLCSSLVDGHILPSVSTFFLHQPGLLVVPHLLVLRLALS